MIFCFLLENMVLASFGGTLFTSIGMSRRRKEKEVFVFFFFDCFWFVSRNLGFSGRGSLVLI